MADQPKRERVTVPAWWIRAARDEAGRRAGSHVTQRRLATLVETTPNTVARWERAAEGVAWVTWLGVLSALDLERQWRPKPTDKRDDEPDA